MARLERFSLGIGDRFGREGVAQLEAVAAATARGVPICPVWNKSNREHTIVGSTPAHTRLEADAAARSLGWGGPYHVDADHISRSTVDPFIEGSDFFTIDVADAIGRTPEPADLDAYHARSERLLGRRALERDERPVGKDDLQAFAARYLTAIREAGHTYRHIRERKGTEAFITEVSMDEAPDPQSPRELYLILAALADEGVDLQTIAPRFCGRFNKGVDYVGDVARFSREFADDLAAVAVARTAFGMDAGLKLSVHSGSDKFALYPLIRNALERTGAGVHLKTAGTTWLEELIGLAEGGGEGLAIAAEVYRSAYGRQEELARPYATVIDVDPGRLPPPEVVDGWDGATYAATLRHDQGCRAYNRDFRQLLHISYRVAAEMGQRFLSALETYRPGIAANVRENLLRRHIEPLFPGAAPGTRGGSRA